MVAESQAVIESAPGNVGFDDVKVGVICAMVRSPVHHDGAKPGG